MTGARIPAEQLSDSLGATPELVPGVFFLPGEDQQQNLPDFSFTPESVRPGVEDAWRAEDALLVTLRDSTAMPLGFVSVDTPQTGLRPSDQDLQLSRAIAAHAEQALETARRNRERDVAEQRDQALLKLATQLLHASTFTELEDQVGEILTCQFGFERAAAHIRAPDGSMSMTLHQTRGCEPDDQAAHLADAIPEAIIHLTLTGRRLQDGCWLSLAS